MTWCLTEGRKTKHGQKTSYEAEKQNVIICILFANVLGGAQEKVPGYFSHFVRVFQKVLRSERLCLLEKGRCIKEHPSLSIADAAKKLGEMWNNTAADDNRVHQTAKLKEKFERYILA